MKVWVQIAGVDVHPCPCAVMVVIGNLHARGGRWYSAQVWSGCSYEYFGISMVQGSSYSNLCMHSERPVSERGVVNLVSIISSGFLQEMHHLMLKMHDQRWHRRSLRSMLFLDYRHYRLDFLSPEIRHRCHCLRHQTQPVVLPLHLSSDLDLG